METIVQITYTNYTENVIMNDAAYNELKKIAKNDSDYIKHEVIQQGTWAFPAKVAKIMAVGKVPCEWGGRASTVYMYRVSYAGKSLVFNSDWPIDILRKNARYILSGSQKFTTSNYMKKGLDY